MRGGEGGGDIRDMHIKQNDTKNSCFFCSAMHEINTLQEGTE